MKTQFSSKTILFAILTVLVGAASAFGFSEFVPDEQLATVLQGVIIVVVGGVNYVLRRWLTDTGIA